MEDAARLLEAISDLLGAILWPAVVLLVLYRFRTPIRELFGDMGGAVRDREWTLRGPGGVEFSAGARVGALIGAAEARKRATGEEQAAAPELSRAWEHEVAGAAAAIVANPPYREGRSRLARRKQRPQRGRILWVDDRPENNEFEVQALRELGIDVRQVRSTDEALRLLEATRYEAVISDMGRPPDQRAGYTLIDEMRRRGNETPFIIYAGSNLPEHTTEAREHGALGSTNDSSELLRLVAQALEETD